MRMPKFGLGFKILMSMLLVAFAGVAAACLLGLFSMESMGRSALYGGSLLAKSAIFDSKASLIAQSCEELLSISRDQAYITDMKLERVATQVNSAARIYGLSPTEEVVEKSPLLRSDRESAPVDTTAFSAFSVAPGTQPAAVEGDIRRLAKMHDIFNFMRYTTPHIKLLYIGTESGVIFKHPWMLTPPGYDHRQRSWYKEAMTRDGLYWSEPYPAASDNRLVITCARAIVDQAGAKIGVAAADISVDAVVRDFIGLQNDRSGAAFLIDGHGRVMAREGMDRVDIEWTQKYDVENLLESKDAGMRDMASKMMRGGAGTCRVTFGGSGCFAGYAPVASCGWSIAVVLPEARILNSALKAEHKITRDFASGEAHLKEFLWSRVHIFLLLSVAVLLAVLFTATWLSRRITEPVLKLKAGAVRIGSGDLDGSFDIRTGDEIEELAVTFNKMSSDLKDYIRDLKETTAARQKIERDLKIAAEIQTSMLPRIFPPFPDRPEIDIFASMEPAKEVGGDLYDFEFIDKDRLFICVGDVSGKGIPAALFMATAKTMLSGLALQGKAPDEILRETNNYLAKDNDACMFITVFCGVLDLRDGTFVCCDGGHNPPLLRAAPGAAFEFLKAPKGMPLGSFPAGHEIYKSLTVKLAPGAVLFAYTDGVTEAMDKAGALFGERRMQDALASAPDDAACQRMVEIVRASAFAYAAEAPQSDDITMLALRLCR